MSEYRSHTPRPMRTKPSTVVKLDVTEKPVSLTSRVNSVLRRIFSPFFCLTLCMLAGLLAGIWMEGAFASGSSIDKLTTMLVDKGIAIQEPVDSRLGHLRSIEVETLNPKLSSQNPPPEVLEAIRTAMQQEVRLPYDSPAEGILRLRCANKRCNELEAEIIVGCSQAPTVLWHMKTPHRANTLEFLPDAHKTANRIVHQLAEDYTRALRPTEDRIDIPETDPS